MRLSRALGLGAAAGAMVLATLHSAHAAGLYFSDRGVRPLGRGGAFVAGADDLGAAWYNPAGLVDAGGTVLVDFAWLNFSSRYTRKTQVADASGTLRTFESPPVEGRTPFLPIPTLGGAIKLNKEGTWVAALSILAPYTPIASYPERTRTGEPSPSRYLLVSLDGSALLIPSLQFAARPVPWLQVGAGLSAVAGSFQSTVVFSASPPKNLLAASEDSDYDAPSRLSVGPIFAPSMNGGIIVTPHRAVRIGVSGQLPSVINAPAKIDVRLPVATLFDNARQVGNNANVRFVLPAIFRVGVEFRPIDNLRVELTFVREFWTTHRTIDITPANIQLVGLTGLPSPFAVSSISIPRNFDNSNSYRIGGEYGFKIGAYPVAVRAGASYEESAIPRAYVSPLTIDAAKVSASLGGSLHVGTHWRFDAAYAQVFTSDVVVSPAEARVPRVNPVAGNPTDTEAVNGGAYQSGAGVAGVGFAYTF